MESLRGRVRLIHWNEAEAAERGERLRRIGYRVDHRVPASASLKSLFDELPDAFVVDLSRLPSHGREMAASLRERKTTRHVPILFVGGEASKVERVRQTLPDALFTRWEDIERDLERAIASPPRDPVVPPTYFDAYSGTPLVKKLGIRNGTSVALIGPPDGFAATLGQLPDGAVLDRAGPLESDLVIWFARSRAELSDGLEDMSRLLGPAASMWIAWQKAASRMVTDLTQRAVRELGLAAGLVDYKVCSIDRTWSGLLFTRRKR